ncbi:hypothetical protein BpHYR1_024642 [Brachionus plicatilis]|uniref:Uncharacterized protein n=1 Tax=Brachionus plicatilis TaxID=10195 RepID=A0A3M7SGM3_BRAPC|nr:hypothetical protein BpHYR1_024642 [Brachionus plicatilis]
MRFFSSNSSNGSSNLANLGSNQQILLNQSQGMGGMGGQIRSLGLSSSTPYSQLAAQGLSNGINAQQLLAQQLPQFPSNQQFLTNGMSGLNGLNSNQLGQMGGQQQAFPNQIQNQLLNQLQNQVGSGQIGLGLQGLSGLNSNQLGQQQIGLNQLNQGINQAQFSQLQGLNGLSLNQLAGLNGQLAGVNLAQLNGLGSNQLGQLAQHNVTQNPNQRIFSSRKKYKHCNIIQKKKFFSSFDFFF